MAKVVTGNRYWNIALHATNTLLRIAVRIVKKQGEETRKMKHFHVTFDILNYQQIIHIVSFFVARYKCFRNSPFQYSDPSIENIPQQCK